MGYVRLVFEGVRSVLAGWEGAVRLEIRFLHEGRDGQQLTVGWERQGDTWLFSIRNEEREAVRASVEWR